MLRRIYKGLKCVINLWKTNQKKDAWKNLAMGQTSGQQIQVFVAIANGKMTVVILKES